MLLRAHGSGVVGTHRIRLDQLLPILFIFLDSVPLPVRR
jgi:hypothetical protein